jgi:hypothetical protein
MELIHPCFNYNNEYNYEYNKENLLIHKKRMIECYNGEKKVSTNSVYKKSIPIQIEKKTDQPFNEYSLSTLFFDPSKSSPPNDFLLKLYARIDKYQKKEDNLCNEY